ncbi:MAG: ATP-binding protein [Collinsella sp.]
MLTRGYVDLSLLLAQVADEFYPTLAEQGKHVEVDAPLNLTVLVDGDKMARVFNNVMKNAIAYSYEGSTIHIEAVRGEGSVTVRFENQGDPIPAAKLGTIFEKFYRLDAARATNRGGAGPEPRHRQGDRDRTWRNHCVRVHPRVHRVHHRRARVTKAQLRNLNLGTVPQLRFCFVSV